MGPRTSIRLAAAVAAGLAIGVQSAGAQDFSRPPARRVAVDTVIGFQDSFGEHLDWPAQFVVDAFTTAEVRRHWQISFRPKVWRVRGDWKTLVDQLSLQTEFRKGSDWRLEAGRFPMPIGLGMTENRPELNAGVLWYHRAYYMPLPSLGAGVPRVSLVSAVYPTGFLTATSASHWDARMAVVDRAPVQFWVPPVGASRRPNVVLGGGITPWQGFRLGAGAAWGQFADATPSRGVLHYAMANVEGEYAFGYTRISGEWTRDVFDTPSGDRAAWGGTLQAQHTLTPRLFVHARASVVHAPEVSQTQPIFTTMREYRSIDTTVGYRLTPALTLRVGHSFVKGFTDSAFSQQAAVSVMWATRWW